MNNQNEIYTKNHSFFKTWSSEMAYVLGFIAADGCVVTDYGLHHWKIHLHHQDKHILESIKNIIEYTGTLYTRYPEFGEKQFVLHISSDEMCKDLRNFGFSRHKSQELKWNNNIPEQYVSHFIRGYFDGDGCVFTKQAHNPNLRDIGCNFVGTKDFIYGLKNIFDSIYGNKVGSIADNDTWHTLIYNGTNIAQVFLNWIYTDSNPEIRLLRKWNKYQDFLCYRESLNLDDYICDSLTYDIAQQMREDNRINGLNMNQLSIKYNINRASISNVLNNITWMREDGRRRDAFLYFTAFGDTKHWKDWFEDERCIVNNLETLRWRLCVEKMEPEIALTLPVDRGVNNPRTQMILAFGEKKSVRQWAQDERCKFDYQKLKRLLENNSLENIFNNNITIIKKKPVAKENGKLGNSKIDLIVVQQIRALHQNNNTVEFIADFLNLKTTLVHDVVGNRTWHDPNYIPRSFKCADGINLRKGVKSPRTVGKTGMTRDIVNLIRTDYSRGLKQTELMEKYNIPKSQYIDIIGNRTWKEDKVWWKETEGIS